MDQLITCIEANLIRLPSDHHGSLFFFFFFEKYEISTDEIS